MLLTAEDFQLLDFLESKYKIYNNLSFIKNDPISIPHMFKNKEDIEISAFLTSTIAWGQRVSIINNAKKMMLLMENKPFEFIVNSDERNLIRFDGFVHRTFNAEDLKYFILSLKHIYNKLGSLEQVFTQAYSDSGNMFDVISQFHKVFFNNPHFERTEKHISNPAKGSAAKRINMFLRWMVRNDNRGVDFGIWKNIPTSALLCPLDLHSGNVARKLGLITRNQNDRKAVEELMIQLRKFDPNDPVKYDFALFGMGVFE